ncbi:UPF0149 family protein [Pasteurellaceae bacterium 20609_3]|uniref:UPF0149 family protein n=1 Tax=Spirabiliibacterium mucosae TaxID=28156 RepID=UPI001AAD5B33|nr:UPF0149 family protein [Spirabiliibacterium mucosae]MBE2897547.1 UPF0149 family protein [Spirabiliibacterium mucosae]
MLTDKEYLSLEQELSKNNIEVSPAELHGFLSGLVCGDFKEQFEPLVAQMYSNGSGNGMPKFVMQQVLRMLAHIREEIANKPFEEFQLWLKPGDAYVRARSTFAWSATFLLGIGFAQRDLAMHGEPIQNALQDLAQIAGTEVYPEADPEEEVEMIMTNVENYLRELVAFFYDCYHSDDTTQKVVH